MTVPNVERTIPVGRRIHPQFTDEETDPEMGAQAPVLFPLFGTPL